MTWEMAMESFMNDAPYMAAILGVTMGLVIGGVMVIRKLAEKSRFYDFALRETESSLISADRVLKNGATPPEVRKALLCVLETMATPELGKEFTRHFSENQDSPRKKKHPHAKSPLSEAMDKLHATHPELAADAHNALMGTILAVPLINADKVDVTELVTIEYVGEGATNPASVFGRASKALSLEKRGNGRGGVEGGYVAA